VDGSGQQRVYALADCPGRVALQPVAPLAADDKARATSAAQLKAVEFYYAEAGQSEAENFDAIRDKILAAPDRYILDTTVLAEEEHKDKIANQRGFPQKKTK
jgi:hypothetical protein